MIELIGVPYDGFGRDGHQARAAEALRAAGLQHALGVAADLSGADLDLPAPDRARASGSGLMNEAALLALTDALSERVAGALAAGRFPIVYGGDCSLLVGAMRGLRDAVGTPGLVFMDGHEDTTPLDVSEDGEAANMEIGLLLGITGKLAPPALRARVPVLGVQALAVLGPRDDELRRELNLGSVAGLGVHLRRCDAVAANPKQAAEDAVDHVRRTASRWWLHIDLDVLDQRIFTAGRVPGDHDYSGGLNWPQLTELTTTAVASGGCAGWSVTIYDPDQDPDGVEAKRIVDFMKRACSSIPNQGSRTFDGRL